MGELVGKQPEQRQEAPLTWKGRGLRTLGDIRTEMIDIHTRQNDQEAVEFMGSLQQRYGNTDAGVIAFQVSGFSETPDEMSGILGRFLQRDFTGEFHITEAPQDEYGNTANKPCIRTVRIAEGYQGRPHLEVLEPAELAKGWPTISPTAWRYFVVDGPARMLTRDEWTKLVDFKAPGSE